MPGPYAFQDTPELRLEVLKLSVEWLMDPEDYNEYSTEDVIDIAKAFLDFVLKPE